jgi:hypothetical protein
VTSGPAGSFAISPSEGFRSGEPTTIAMTVTVGESGIAVGGRIKISLPNMGWSEPLTPYPRACQDVARGDRRQVAIYNPCNTTFRLTSSRGAGVSLTHRRSQNVLGRYDNWSWWVTAEVELAPLQRGDGLLLTYGDTSRGEQARVQPWAEEQGVFFSAFADPEGTGEYRELLGSPVACAVRAGRPERVLLTVPSVVRPGRLVPVRASLGDAGLMPVPVEELPVKRCALEGQAVPLFARSPEGRADSAGPGDDRPRRLRIEVVTCDGRSLAARSNPCVARPDGPSLYWGDLHCHSRYHQYSPRLGRGHPCTSPAELLAYARDVAHLDFAAMTDGSGALPHNPGWEEAQRAVIAADAPGSFVALKGWEIQMGTDGHRNVIHRDAEVEGHVAAEAFRETSIAGAAGSRGMRAVLGHYRGRRDVLLVPHHPLVWMNWDCHDPELDRLAEIYSCWGSSEAEHGELWDKASPPRQSVRYALSLGHRLGFVGGGDSHTGYAGRSLPDADRYRFARYRAGYTGVWAPELTREAIFQALRDRRCYATTGERIIGECEVDGHPMGAGAPLGDHREAHGVRYRFVGTERLRRVEIIRDGEVVHSVEPYVDEIEDEWRDTSDDARQARYYYVKATQVDGSVAWLSPVWVGSLGNEREA